MRQSKRREHARLTGTGQPRGRGWKARRIEDLLRGQAQKLKSGDRFGSERGIAQELGVHRLTVRKAIKALCREGVLRQPSTRGTFVACPGGIVGTPLDSAAARALTPLGGSYSRVRQEVLVLSTDDCLPTQRAAWLRLAAGAAKACGGIEVDIHFGAAAAGDASDYDLRTAMPRDVGTRRVPVVADAGIVGAGWYASHPLRLPVSRLLRQGVERLLRHPNGQRGIAFAAQLPVHILNTRLLAANGCGSPPPRQEPAALEAWLAGWQCAAPDCPVYPFFQSGLNHLLRHEPRLLDDGTDAGPPWPEATRFLRLLERVVRHARGSRDVVDCSERFLGEQAASIELHSNLLTHVATQFAGRRQDLAAVPSPAARGGLIQVLPRFLVPGQGGADPAAVSAFCEFVASPAGQELVATTGLGLPVYLGREGVELFAAELPVQAGDLLDELRLATEAYDSRFFTTTFQTDVVEPTLQRYCRGLIDAATCLGRIRAGARVANYQSLDQVLASE